MWITVVLAVAIFGAALAGMAVGVILMRRPLKGSCGGLANMKDSKGNTICDGCTTPSPSCQGEPLQTADACTTDGARSTNFVD